MNIADRATLPAGPQVRSYPANFEVRGESGSLVTLSGIATTFDQPYEMYDMYGAYTERVKRDAFTKTLAERPDVAYLANHEGLTMARTVNNTLELSPEDQGLRATATVNTKRSDVRDLVTAIEDGDVDQMSFAFRVVRQEWDENFEQRDLVELNLNRGDVSAVNFGANPNTNVGLQRAFRTRQAADLHRLAVELREGKPLTDSAAARLSQALDLIAATDEDVPTPPVAARNAASLDFLRRQLELEAR